MKSFFKSFFASLLAIVVVLGILMLIGAGFVASTSKEEPIKEGSYLVIDLYGGIEEYNPPSGVMAEITGGKPETLTRILGNLKKAAVDDKIKGVILKMSASNSAGLAMIEEMRGAIKNVQEHGKKVYGFADTMNRKTYYLAGACDSVFMPKTAYFNFIGLAAVTEHLRGTLDKLGINPNIHKIKDYKSAAEMVLNKKMSDTARENKNWMLKEYWDMTIGALEEDRGITEKQAVEIMKMVLLSAEQARQVGLVDRVLYWDEVEDMLKGDDEKLKTVSQGRYAKVSPRTLGFKGDKKIAIVHAQGMIGGRKSKIDPMLGIMMGHESVISDIRKARDNDKVAAIIFRVNSGGGEALASDLMGHEIELAAQVKPVVVSMVNVAASGGYHISYRASKIVADPTTLTGSIGSISGKFNMKGLFDKLGITHDYADLGPNAMFFSDFMDFSDKQWEIYTKDHWQGFNSWLKDVSEHRGMTFEEAEKLAHGRVWTGRQAKDNGLVDELGGLEKAIAVAKELAEIPADEEVTIVHYPVSKGLIESILSGQGSFATVAKYVVYRYIKDDLAETWDMVTNRQMYMIDDIEVR